jgi:hypothetical protein
VRVCDARYATFPATSSRDAENSIAGCSRDLLSIPRLDSRHRPDETGPRVCYVS